MSSHYTALRRHQNSAAVPKGKFRLCVDQARLNQAMFQPVHKELSVNVAFTKLTNAKYLTIMDIASDYHNLKLGK